MLISRTNLINGKTRTMDLDVTQEQLDRWQNGELIQNVMSHLTAAEREFLITGMTDDEWKELFG